MGSVIIPFSTALIPIIVQNPAPLSGAHVLAQLRRLNDPNSVVFAPPFSLEEIADIPNGPEDLKALSGFVVWGGREIRAAKGDALARAGNRMITGYGRYVLASIYIY